MNPGHIIEWLLALALATGAAAVVVGVVGERFARAGQVIEDARSEVLPGPGQPQASGTTPDDNTHIKGWSAAEIAYLRGELKELPK